MKITRLFIIALMVISAGVFTSCKDYEEDNYNDLAVEQATVKDALQKQIDELTGQLTELKGSIPAGCQCGTKGYLTIEDLADYVKTSDLSAYATKADLSAYATNVALSNAIAKAEQELAAAKQALESTIQQQAQAIEALNSQITTINGLLAQKADKSEVTALENKILELLNGKADTATVSALQTALNNLANEVATKANQSDITNLQTQITNLVNQMADKADKSDITNLQTQITNLVNQMADKADKQALEDLTGRVEVLEGKIPTIEQKAADALAKAETNYLLITALQQKVSQDSLVIMQALADSTKMILDSIASVKEELKEYTDKAIADAVKDLATKDYVDTKVGELKSEIMTALANKADKADLEALETRVETLEGKVSTLETKVGEIMSQLAELQQRIEEIVTDIKIQSVYNSAIGSLNTPLDINTNILVAYYGKATEAVSFPYSDYNLLYNSEDEAYAANEILIGDEGNAGTLYVTVNPSTADFTGLNVSLVNSQDEECAVKLGKLQKTNEVLTFGYSRAADNGFYAVPATLSKNDIYNSKLKINFDAGEVKTAVTELVKKHNGESIKDFASSIFKTLNNLNNSLDAQAVKCTDATGRSVYSNYDVAAVAVNPLGFKAVDGFFPRTSFPGYNRLVNFITKAQNKVATSIKKNLEGINGSIDDIKDMIDIEIDHVAFDSDQNFNITFRFRIGTDGTNYTCHVGDPANGEESDYLYIYGPNPSDPFGPTTQVARFKLSDDPIQQIDTNLFELTYVKDASDYRDLINSAVDGVNVVLDNVEGQLDDLADAINNIIVQIKDLEDKITGDGYMTRVYRYLDKMNSYATKAINKIPALFHPVILINSDNGFGIAGGSKVKGDVTIYLTTGSAELVAPCFKKYYAIDNKYSGQLYEGTSVNLGTLSKGYHTIYYSALDYVGQRYEVEAKIYVE